jgi:formate/nitrite transporter FocA (FNT family)
LGNAVGGTVFGALIYYTAYLRIVQPQEK